MIPYKDWITQIWNQFSTKKDDFSRHRIQWAERITPFMSYDGWWDFKLLLVIDSHTECMTVLSNHRGVKLYCHVPPAPTPLQTPLLIWRYCRVGKKYSRTVLVSSYSQPTHSDEKDSDFELNSSWSYLTRSSILYRYSHKLHHTYPISKLKFFSRDRRIPSGFTRK